MSVGATQHRVVIIGGGFGGLLAAKGLRRAPVEVTMIDRRNFHVFQPLLYQVATGGLSPANIAAPIRSILRRQRNVTTLMAEVADIDAHAHHVILTDGTVIPYDTLILAAGAETSWFGHADWPALAPGLKTLEDATLLRSRILTAFESAERETSPERQREGLNFVVIGGGPTGVEMAGAIAEIAHATLRREFRRIDPDAA